MRESRWVCASLAICQISRILDSIVAEMKTESARVRLPNQACPPQPVGERVSQRGGLQVAGSAGTSSGVSP
eukprot:2742618-Rhodomonas_salina.1